METDFAISFMEIEELRSFLDLPTWSDVIMILPRTIRKRGSELFLTYPYRMLTSTDSRGMYLLHGIAYAREVSEEYVHIKRDHKKVQRFIEERSQVVRERKEVSYTFKSCWF
jgi:hypothetical protein